MAPSFDVFLAVAPKDYFKLPYVVGAIVENIHGFRNICICSPTDIPTDVLSKIPAFFYTYLDENLLTFDRSKWKYRPNWAFQQHLKLFQRVTCDWYVTIDCDTIINKPLEFFEGDKPIWWLGYTQNQERYFKFQQKMIGIGKVFERSFIADMNFFHRPFIDQMLSDNGYDVHRFILRSQDIISKDCWIAEPELYGSWCHVSKPGFYVYKALKPAPFEGRMQHPGDSNVWTEDELVERIQRMKATDYDTFSIHSWMDEGDQP